MAKVFIEESTLTNIGNAIREKESSTELIPVTDMATRISAIETGGGGNEPTAEELTVTGSGSYRFGYNGWNWLIDKYGNKITTKNLTSCDYMFQYSTKLENIPFQININNVLNVNNVFSNCNNLKTAPKIRGTIQWSTSTNLTSVFDSCYNIRDVEDVFTPEMLDGYATVKAASSYSCPKVNGNVLPHQSLRQIPSWFYKFKLNPESTAFPTSTYSIYYSLFNFTALDEFLNIPVWKCKAALTSNMFGSNVYMRRAKNFTFETNSDGTPIVTEWKSQTINLSEYVGYESSSYDLSTASGRDKHFKNSDVLKYNSGITSDKFVYDDATYQALKNDPDWFTAANTHQTAYYSRYNYESAVATINSLPDTSAYVATAGGTNTIKFNKTAGSSTDGGSFSTHSEEEIAELTARAFAKGWTVALSN